MLLVSGFEMSISQQCNPALACAVFALNLTSISHHSPLLLSCSDPTRRCSPPITQRPGEPVNTGSEVNSGNEVNAADAGNEAGSDNEVASPKQAAKPTRAVTQVETCTVKKSYSPSHCTVWGLVSRIFCYFSKAGNFKVASSNNHLLCPCIFELDSIITFYCSRFQME